MARRFYACSFKPGGRTFTYHHDGDRPFAKGDRVKVAAARGDGWAIVTVEYPVERKPAFDTKPILGAAEEAPEPATPAAADAAVAAARDLFSAANTQ